MPLKFVRDGQILDEDTRQYSDLNNFSYLIDRDIVFEWIRGQYWLHSDIGHEKPIGIDIDQELLRHEEYFRKSSLQKELLAKAIGIKGAYRPKVLDLTAGMLGDSLLFLSFGCEVWAIERHPIVQFLIESALKNAKHPKLERFHFLKNDALSLLKNPPDVHAIYFDPMFEDASSKSSPKKKMRIFREIVGPDEDAEDVFQAALGQGPKRLIVKRPRHSVHLVKPPSVEYIGKSTRYDVYFSL